jgi:acetyltransferase (GNAT) family protein
MALRFTRLTAENVTSARTLLAEWWPGNWSDEFVGRFFTWRYLTRPAGETLLAVDGDRCVAILDSYLRPYLFCGETATIRETCDWYCLPEYRPLGVGLKLIRQMMAKPEPLVVVGGTEATHSLLPRLKWQRLPDVPIYVLPLSLKTALAFGLQKRAPTAAQMLASVIPPGLRLFRPHQLPSPVNSAQVTASSGLEVPGMPSPNPYALALLLDGDNLNWLLSAPKEVGYLLVLRFLINGRLVAISITRLQRRREGLTAKVLHIQSEDRSPAMMGWIVSATALHLAEKGASLIICLSSDIIIGNAFRRVGFIAAGQRPAFWWSADKRAPTGAMHLTKMVGDDEAWAE